MTTLEKQLAIAIETLNYYTDLIDEDGGHLARVALGKIDNLRVLSEFDDTQGLPCYNSWWCDEIGLLALSKNHPTEGHIHLNFKGNQVNCMDLIASEGEKLTREFRERIYNDDT